MIVENLINYTIERRPDIIPNELGLQPQDIEDAKKLFGDKVFALNLIRQNDKVYDMFK